MSLPIAAAIAVLLFTRFGPDIPLTRTLRYHLAERPARWIAGHALRDVIFVALTAGLLLTGGQMWALLGTEFMFGYIADLSLYFDVLAVAWLTGAIGGFRRALRAVGTPFERVARAARARFGTAARARRSRPETTRSAPANDDGEGGAAVALAA